VPFIALQVVGLLIATLFLEVVTYLPSKVIR